MQQRCHGGRKVNKIGVEWKTEQAEQRTCLNIQIGLNLFRTLRDEQFGSTFLGGQNQSL